MILSRFVHFTVALLFLCTIVEIGVLHVAWAKPRTKEGQANQDKAATKTSDPKIDGTLVSETWSNPTERLEYLFSRVQQRLNSHQQERAGEELHLLHKTALQFGYTNLPQYSFELLHRAERTADQGKDSEVRFLIEGAVLLSPDNVRVLLATSWFSRIIGWSGMRYLVRGVLRLHRYPLVVENVFLNVLLMSLLAITLSLFIVCIIQFVRNMPFLLREISQVLPPKIAGFLGPIFVVAMFIVPLRGGILLALGCWGLFLEFFVKHCKRLGLFTAMLLGCWWAGIILLERVGAQVTLEQNLAIENIHNGSFTLQDKAHLEQALRQQPDDWLLLFSYGQKLEHEGLVPEAIGVFERLLQVNRQGSLEVPILIHLGALHFLQGEYLMAKELFLEAEKRGGDSFELFYDLSQVSFIMSDLEKWRSYYNLAKRRDEQRLRMLEENTDQQEGPLFVGIHSTVLFYQLLKRVHEGEVFFRPQISSEGQQLARSLVSFGSLRAISMLSLSVLVVWMIISMSPWTTRDYSFLEDHNKKPSAIWFFLPAGIYLSGSKPIAGVLLLALVFGFFMAGVERPAELFPLIPFPHIEGALIGYQLFLWCSLFLMLTIAVVSILSGRKRMEKSKE